MYEYSDAQNSRMQSVISLGVFETSFRNAPVAFTRGGLA